jgi:hypothetical protein
MSYIQPSLDFDGEDPELALRMRWAENRRREREFWTPERHTLSWMLNVTPDDSDMAWWARQPKYKRQNWLDLHQRERDRMRRLKVWRRSFQEAWEEWEAIINEGIAQDERQIARWMEILRDDFLHGRPCSISLETCDPSIKWQAEHNLSEALRRLAIPPQCLQPQPPHEPPKRTRKS